MEKTEMTDKQFDKIQDQKKQLAALQKENEQLQVNIENNLNLNNIEKLAKEKEALLETVLKKLQTLKEIEIH